MDQKDVPGDIFIPFVNAYNVQCHSLIQMLYLVFDESMSWWRPKNIESVGLPNRTFDPRKSVPLSIMILNGVECST